MADSSSRYRSLSAWLKARFGEPVRKITVDAGLGCPNRDGTISTGGCLYSDHRGSGTGVFSRGVSIREQVDRGIEVLSRKFRCKKFIAYLSIVHQHARSVERLRQIYWEALFRPEIVGLAVGTRPDCVSEKVLDLMAQLAGDRLVWMEYPVSSRCTHAGPCQPRAWPGGVLQRGGTDTCKGDPGSGPYDTRSAGRVPERHGRDDREPLSLQERKR